MMMHQTIETNFGEKEAEKYLKDWNKLPPKDNSKFW
jgi:hypothetical protein